VILLPT